MMLPCFLRDHDSGGFLATEEHAFQVDINYLVEVFLRRFLCSFMEGNASVVHTYIKSAKFSCGGGKCLFHFCCLADICSNS